MFSTIPPVPRTQWQNQPIPPVPTTQWQNQQYTNPYAQIPHSNNNHQMNVAPPTFGAH